MSSRPSSTAAPTDARYLRNLLLISITAILFVLPAFVTFIYWQWVRGPGTETAMAAAMRLVRANIIFGCGWILILMLPDPFTGLVAICILYVWFVVSLARFHREATTQVP